MAGNKPECKGIVRIGTSGIVVPGTKQTFPQEFQAGSRLHYYSSLFNSIEINSSFYKIHLPSTFKKWSEEVSDNFKFTVKLWRGITHVKKLLYSLDDIDVFMQAANCLGNKKGCLLMQFPASITFEYLHEVEKIIQRLDQINSDGGWRLAIEFRHLTWYNNLTYSMLARYNSSLVLHDMPASRTPMDNPCNDIVYLRFHGPNGDYKGSYNDEALESYAVNIRNRLQEGKDVYVYFNNTIGSALHNAQSLQKLI